MSAQPTSIEAIIQNLRSGDIERQTHALEDAASSINQLVAEAISAFVRSDAKIPLAERLIPLGTSIQPGLERLLSQPCDEETRVHASAVLLYVGSRAGVPCLMDHLTNNSAFADFSALQLSKAGVTEASEPIERILRTNIIATQPYVAFGLISSLRKLGPISDNLKHHLVEQCPQSMKEGLVRDLEKD